VGDVDETVRLLTHSWCARRTAASAYAYWWTTATRLRTARRIRVHRRQVFMVSMNFDQRSKRSNTEIGLIIESPRGEGPRLQVGLPSFLPLDREL